MGRRTVRSEAKTKPPQCRNPFDGRSGRPEQYAVRKPGRLPKGQSLALIAVAFVAILAFVGFVVDTGIVYLHRVWLGQAVDSASLAAGFELPNIRGACARAVEYLETNGYDPRTTLNFQIIFPAVPDAPSPPGDPGQFVIDSAAAGIRTAADCANVAVPSQHENVHYQVQVSASQRVPVIFMGLVGFDRVSVGVPSVSERSARYDVALVLDTSGSMKFDTCGWYRPEDAYACQNRYGPCTAFYEEDFEGYTRTDQLAAAGWTVNAGVALVNSGGLGSSKAVELSREGGERGSISRRVDTRGWEDVAFFFWARNLRMRDSDALQVFWRPSEDVGWSLIATLQGAVLPSSGKSYSVLLPSAAANNPDLEIRIGADSSKGGDFLVDEMALNSCPQNRGPWAWYKMSVEEGCRPERTMTCASSAPHTLLPGVSTSSSNPPMAQFLEQPMLDVLLASETFIDLLDTRHLPTQPREDQVGLASFDAISVNLHDLTTDYESVKTTLFSDIHSEGGTNIGGGIYVGLSILGDGRGNATHFMVLLTDGWPNFYDWPYTTPASFGWRCSTNDPCRRTLEYIDAQVEQARRQNVTIFTIGLGEDLRLRHFDASSACGPGTERYTGMDLLRRIAEGTGGMAYHAPTSEELEQIFEWIAEAIFVRLTG